MCSPPKPQALGRQGRSCCWLPGPDGRPRTDTSPLTPGFSKGRQGRREGCRKAHTRTIEGRSGPTGRMQKSAQNAQAGANKYASKNTQKGANIRKKGANINVHKSSINVQSISNQFSAGLDNKNDSPPQMN